MIKLINPTKNTSALMADISSDKEERYKEVDGFVFSQYLEYLETGQYPYLANVVEFILPKLPKLSEKQKNQLKTQVYNASQKHRENKELEYHNKMIAAGWEILTKNVVKKAFAEKKKVKVSAKMSTDWLSTKIDKIYKPFVHPVDGTVMLMKPKARTRGYYIHRFENAFCKIV